MKGEIRYIEAPLLLRITQQGKKGLQKQSMLQERRRVAIGTVISRGRFTLNKKRLPTSRFVILYTTQVTLSRVVLQDWTETRFKVCFTCEVCKVKET